jgi:hypothetical protein
VEGKGTCRLSWQWPLLVDGGELIRLLALLGCRPGPAFCWKSFSIKKYEKFE